ncbi:MAG: tRNA (adenosine(37)-N6)-threonylcarbamoyltransferase complex transferase subunit TsaD [Bacteroidetes bacterium]|nr:tRNA (adenosine(37)-N6)-threonylcarbamoyltransferase complex transferase subunit TsaD [Rhodothermia bacterium]MCS7155595.1 tRNA (adenosine(37)-N6)-threonylcarbamoyltransferase complex transferase subunit TsaD [Bacteroidota bacterium]MCX7906453.1 tRNA (adenosine(37)-N6)-threonylcarbamoyltransferase complex transferase subunit TsaD [Bacteroidota bacterium]MDW8137265.1 tRNA (adenosine(37)-N6)-threonylcarbamoyltransferase complex transferase subunit TsaD [Bacteroidota bacterium]MDW8284865.1 tRNA
MFSVSQAHDVAPDRVILGIESSCDETAAAVLIEGRLAAHVVSSQLDHRPYGGVVPELASRAHLRRIVPVVERALAEAQIRKADLTAVAVTYGPGLIGSLLVGTSFAKALASALGIPLVGVHHLEGHIYAIFLEPEPPPFPFLCLVVSGGHTALVRVEAPFRHRTLGQTRDDAAGEALDKVAKLLGLEYPGGPAIERLAAEGDPRFLRLPRPNLGPSLDYSFSGLKTAVLHALKRLPDPERTRLRQEHLADLAASFQTAVVEALLEPLLRAAERTGDRHVVLSGGVAANRALRRRLQEVAAERSWRLYVPRPAFCTDNAAMIAMAGYLKLRQGHQSPLSLAPQATVPL